MCNEKIICAGFGGQGVMSMGQLLAYAGMLENKHVTWMPSYGPEMRGGTAYCCVVVADSPVGSPIITSNASCVIVMNQPSLVKFERLVAPGGVILVNSSMTEMKVGREDILPFYIPAIDLAKESGNSRASNMVMLGVYLAMSMEIDPESVLTAFTKVFGGKAKELLPQNRAALYRGMEWIQENNVHNTGAGVMWDVPHAA